MVSTSKLTRSGEATAIRPWRGMPSAAVLAAAVSLATLGLLVTSAPGANATTTGPRPTFSAPFACGQTWKGTTYTDHTSWDAGNVTGNNLAIDFNLGTGSDDLGEPVLASASGIVRRLSGSSTNNVEISHGGNWYTFYAHMTVAGFVPIAGAGKGVQVTKGQVIGYVDKVGTSSPHLHYAQVVGVGDGRYEQKAVYLEGAAYSSPQAVTSLNCGQADSDAISDGPLDFNGDGKTDVFSRASDGSWRYVSGGSGTWIEAGLSSSNIPLSELRFGDFNGDGKTDVFSTIEEDGALRWRYASAAKGTWINLTRSGIALGDLRM